MSSLNSVSGMLIRTKLPKLNFCFVCKMQVSGGVFKYRWSSDRWQRGKRREIDNTLLLISVSSNTLYSFVQYVCCIIVLISRVLYQGFKFVEMIQMWQGRDPMKAQSTHSTAVCMEMFVSSVTCNWKWRALLQCTLVENDIIQIQLYM